MKPLRLLALTLAVIGPAVSLRADSTTAPTPVCAVASDPQVVSSSGILHVLDSTNSVIDRWSLAAGAARPPLPVTSDVVAIASLSARNAVVFFHSTTPRLTLRPELVTGTEQPFALLPSDAVPCGLGSNDQVVVACIDQDQYLVFDAEGNLLAQLQVGDVTDATTPSWDGMTWDPVSSTLFAIRVEGSSRSAIALPLAADGALGDPQVVALPDSTSATALADELPAVSPDGSQLVVPDGLVVATDSLAAVTVPETSGGDVFLVGDDLFTVGAATQVGLAGCALSAQQPGLLSNALLKPTLVRSAQWQGHAFLLRGDAASGRLIPLSAPGDLDADLAPDAQDVFPLDAVMVKDWDHDGVGDQDDAFPTNPHEWQDVDGDGIGDNEEAFDPDGDGVGGTADAFPDDPLEWKDSDGDGVGDNGDAFPNDPTRWQEPFNAITQVYAVDLVQNAGLNGFADSVSSRGAATFALADANRFILDLPSGEQLVGTTAATGTSGKKLALQFDIATLSLLERDFETAAAGIVASDPADPPSPPLKFIPHTVLSDGMLSFTKRGVSVALRARFAFPRRPHARGARGGFSFRGNGTPDS